METEKTLNKFGEFLVQNLRDSGINFAEGLLKNHWKTPELLNLQNEIQALSSNQKNIVRQVVVATIDSAIHDFLFAIVEQADFDNDIQIIVDNKNIVELSDGLHGEPYSKDGWYARFSKYNPKEIK
jgi:hypothetical protein